MPVTYSKNYLLIHGTKQRAEAQGYSNVEVSTAAGLSVIYPNVVNPDPGHFTGNPAFCMHLTVSDFFSELDGVVGLTISSAGVTEFPAYNKDKNHFFGYPFQIKAALFLNAVKQSEYVLFSKPASARTWSYDSYKMSSPIRLSTRLNSPTDKVVFAIFNYSSCTCNQADQNRPVYVDDITSYIPPAKGYVWRKFGTLAEEQALASEQGYTLTEQWKNLSDNKWHLVRPFYIMRNTGSSNRWTSIES